MTDKIQTKQPKVKKGRRSASLDKKKAKAGWIFVLPFVLGFVLIYLPIVIDSLHYSIAIWDGGAKGTQQFLIQNGDPLFFYKSMFTKSFGSKDFLTEILLEGLGDIILDIPMILMFSLFMAVLLNQKLAGRGLFRAILFVPVIISTGIMVAVEAGSASFDSHVSGGISMSGDEAADAEGGFVSISDMSWLFESLAGTVFEPLLTFVLETINNIFDVISRSGVQILIFLAGLQSISPAIYESVQIDGATSWETFWKITFPMISPMILVNAVYTVIDTFTGENIITEFIENVKIGQYKATGFEGEMYRSESVAMYWVYFLVVIAILGIVAGVMSSYVFYQKKK